MATASRKFQAPKGTRDFYPQDMAVRRYIEGVWRKVSINHGFDEIEGPMFEDIELYKHKSGPGIVSEIFQVFSGKDEKEIASIRGGQDAPFALRPEFTPTLARMVAAKAAELPRPIKWFAIPSHFRAERPQRGRLREFMQWNVDFIGDDSPKADAEVIACAIGAMEKLGLTPNDLAVRYADRNVLQATLVDIGIPQTDTNDWLAWIDRYEKIDPKARIEEAHKFGGTESQIRDIEALWSAIAKPDVAREAKASMLSKGMSADVDEITKRARQLVGLKLRASVERMVTFEKCMDYFGLSQWGSRDFRIVRGLAYYTGTVFEIHETTGAERAIAGGGRYDNLIESFGGPSLPACGFGMGDVVLANILHDKNLLPEDVYMKPLRPHAFAIALDVEAEKTMRQTVAQLRREGFHIRHSYKTTRNVGKLLGDASKSRAMSAIIFGKDTAAQQIDLKDLQSGEQTTIAIAELKDRLKTLIAQQD